MARLQRNVTLSGIFLAIYYKFLDFAGGDYAIITIAPPRKRSQVENDCLALFLSVECCNHSNDLRKTIGIKIPKLVYLPRRLLLS